MKQSYSDYLTEQQRLVILRLLLESLAYKSNSSVLYGQMAQWGLAISRDKLKTELRWLAEQGALSIQVIEEVFILTLTSRGADVAKGIATIDGIAKPGA